MHQIHSGKLMEIHILLAGVEFGPYTDGTARKLIADGFLAESDPAKRLDETEWIPLSEVLLQPREDEAPAAGSREEQPSPPASFSSPAEKVTPVEVDEPVPTPRAEAAFFSAASEKSRAKTAPLFSPEPEKEIFVPPPAVPSAAPPLIHVSVPSRTKSKATGRTGSLLAKEALEAARARVGASPQAAQTTPLPTRPLPSSRPIRTPTQTPAPVPTPAPKPVQAAPSARRPRSPIVLGEQASSKAAKVPPKRGIRLLAPTTPAPAPHLTAAPAPEAPREIVSRKSKTGRTLLGQITRPSLLPSARETAPLEAKAPPLDEPEAKAPPAPEPEAKPAFETRPDSGPFPDSAPLPEPPFAAPPEPGLTSSGELAEKRSLKITGSLKQAAPRTPIRLTTSFPYKVGDSGRLKESAESGRPPMRPVPTESKIWGPEAPAARAPFTTAKIPLPEPPLESPKLDVRPPTAKIPVSEMPPEGLKIRSTRRLTARIPIPEAPKIPEPAAAPEPLPVAEALASPEMNIAPALEIAEPAVSPPLIAEALAPAPDLAKPEKTRLRRPVKLELSSRAKLEDSGPLTLEAFSKIDSQTLSKTLPEVQEPPTTPAPAEPGIPVAERPASAETAEIADTVPLSPVGDFPPPRLSEVRVLDTTRFDTPKPQQPWLWLAYAIIALGVMAFVLLIYLALHRAPTVSTARNAPAVTNTNTSNTTNIVTSSNGAPASFPSRSNKPDVNQQVNAYVTDGMSSFQRGDLDAALAAFNHALDLNPKSADALYNRGLTKAAQDDTDGAVADYSQALQVDPRMSPAYYSRGLARHSKGDLDGAVGDYNLAVQMDPKNALAYFNRGLIRMQKDDIDGAIVDSGRALELDQRLIQSYYNRGLGRLAKGAMDAALSDMKTFCTLAPQDAYTDYARLYIWLIRTQQNQLAEANQELSQAMNSGWNGSADSMVTKIGEFLLGQISEGDLVAASASPIPVKDQGQRCEAWYFIGMRRLEAGDKETAAADLRKCVETQKTDYCEYILAQEQLKTLSPAGAVTSDVVTPPPAPAAK